MRRNPYNFAANLINTKPQATVTFDQTTAEAHFTSTYSDPDRTSAYQPFHATPSAPPPTHLSPTHPPSFKTFCAVLQKRRNKSCPGPNGIPYLLYKRCSRLRRLLFHALVKVWTAGCEPTHFGIAYMILLPKSSDASHPKLMRNIALSNCEGKLFWALVSQSLMEHMTENKYFDGKVQKGFMPGVPGCIEHTSQLQAAIQDAQTHKRSICVSWIDAENAFGSIRHMLIQHALSHYHVPFHLRRLVYNHYQRLFAKVTTPDFTTSVFQYQIGVFQGGTDCTVLFNVVFQLLLDTVNTKSNREHCAYKFKADNTMALLLAAYADDLELVTITPQQNQELLGVSESWFLWTRGMRMKPPKCVAFAAKRFPSPTDQFTPFTKHEYSPYDPQLRIYGETILAVGQTSFKYLGKLIHATDRATKDMRLVRESVMKWIALIDQTPLLNAHRLWLYSNYLVSKISWWLTVCECQVHFCRKLDRAVLPFLKKWGGIPKPGNTAILFCGTHSRPGLNTRTITTTWQAMQVVKCRLLQNSADPRSNFIYHEQSKREHASLSNAFAPTVALASITALSQQPSARPQRLGLGVEQNTRQIKLSASKYFSELDNQSRLSHSKTLQMQGKWAEWDARCSHDLTWQKLVHGMTDGMLKWHLNAPNNSLPSWDNLRRWSQSRLSANCKCCGKPNPTLLHVLNHCPVALNQGRFSWRHDSVLDVIFTAITTFAQSITTPTANSITFVRVGEKGSAQPQTPPKPGLLPKATDWVLTQDKKSCPAPFPPHIAITNQRPDIVLYSPSLRKVVMIELTCPIEDNIEGAYASSKRARYADLERECIANGWSTHLYTVVVGSRGYCAGSVRECLLELGLDRTTANKTVQEASSAASRCSYIIFTRRNVKEWVPPS